MTRLRNRGMRCSRDATSARTSARRNRPRRSKNGPPSNTVECADVHRRLDPLELQEARVECAEPVVGTHGVRLRQARHSSGGSTGGGVGIVHPPDAERRGRAPGLGARAAPLRTATASASVAIAVGAATPARNSASTTSWSTVASHSSTRAVSAFGWLEVVQLLRVRDVRCRRSERSPARSGVVDRRDQQRGPWRSAQRARQVDVARCRSSCADRRPPSARTPSGHRQRSDDQRRERECPAPQRPIPLASPRPHRSRGNGGAG